MIQVCAARLAIAATVSLLLLPSVALPINRNGIVSGAGTSSCGQWVEHRRVGNEVAWRVTTSWAQGFISGHNAYTADKGAGRITANDAAVTLWFDSYCRSNPQHNILEATEAFLDAKGGPRTEFDWKRP